MDANGGVTIVMDAKQMNNNAFRLSNGGQNKDVQLSKDWIESVLDKLPDDSPAKVAINEAFRSQTLRTAIGGVDRSTKKLTIIPVDGPRTPAN